MRLTTPVLAVAAAAMLAACGSLAAPRPDPTGDAAFVAQLKALCSKTPALVPIDASAGLSAITSAANANNATVTNFLYGPPVAGPNGTVERHGGLAVLTPTISSASPLALPITNAAEMLVDMSKWYVLIATPPTPAKLKQLSRSPGGVTAALTKQAVGDDGTATARLNQAHADLAKIDVTSCLT